MVSITKANKVTRTHNRIPTISMRKRNRTTTSTPNPRPLISIRRLSDTYRHCNTKTRRTSFPLKLPPKSLRMVRIASVHVPLTLTYTPHTQPSRARSP